MKSNNATHKEKARNEIIDSIEQRLTVLLDHNPEGLAETEKINLYNAIVKEANQLNKKWQFNLFKSL